MSSLNSQESSNDICRLTDKQQAEYRDAYREYIAQMAQLEISGSGGERPKQPHPGQFLQAGSSEDKGVSGLSSISCHMSHMSDIKVALVLGLQLFMALLKAPHEPLHVDISSIQQVQTSAMLYVQAAI